MDKFLQVAKALAKLPPIEIKKELSVDNCAKFQKAVDVLKKIVCAQNKVLYKWSEYGKLFNIYTGTNYEVKDVFDLADLIRLLQKAGKNNLLEIE